MTTLAAKKRREKTNTGRKVPSQTFNSPGGIYMPTFGKKIIFVSGHAEPGYAPQQPSVASYNPATPGNISGYNSIVPGTAQYNPPTPGNIANANYNPGNVANYNPPTPGNVVGNNPPTGGNIKYANGTGYGSFAGPGAPAPFYFTYNTSSTYNPSTSYYASPDGVYFAYTQYYADSLNYNPVVQGTPNYNPAVPGNANYNAGGNVAGYNYNPPTPGNAIYNPPSGGNVSGYNPSYGGNVEYNPDGGGNLAGYNPTVPGSQAYNPPVPYIKISETSQYDSPQWGSPYNYTYYTRYDAYINSFSSYNTDQHVYFNASVSPSGTGPGNSYYNPASGGNAKYNPTVPGNAYYTPETPGNANYNPYVPGNANYNPSNTGTANYNPSTPGNAIYNNYVAGRAGASTVVLGIPFPGGAQGSPAPTVGRTMTYAPESGAGIAIELPPNSSVVIEEL